MSFSAVFKYMAKQAVDCRNMVRVKVLHTHTTLWLLKNYSQRILTYNTRILLLALTYGRTMAKTMCPNLAVSVQLRLVIDRQTDRRTDRQTHYDS